MVLNNACQVIDQNNQKHRARFNKGHREYVFISLSMGEPGYK